MGQLQPAALPVPHYGFSPPSGLLTSGPQHGEQKEAFTLCQYCSATAQKPTAYQQCSGHKHEAHHTETHAAGQKVNTSLARHT